MYTYSNTIFSILHIHIYTHIVTRRLNGVSRRRLALQIDESSNAIGPLVLRNLRHKIVAHPLPVENYRLRGAQTRLPVRLGIFMRFSLHLSRREWISRSVVKPGKRTRRPFACSRTYLLCIQKPEKNNKNRKGALRHQPLKENPSKKIIIIKRKVF